MQDQRSKDLGTRNAAIVDTVTGYMPGAVQDAIHVGSAGYSARGDIGKAIDNLAGAVNALPGRVEKSVKAGVDGASVTVKPSVNDILPERGKARVN